MTGTEALADGFMTGPPLYVRAECCVPLTGKRRFSPNMIILVYSNPKECQTLNNTFGEFFHKVPNAPKRKSKANSR